MTRLEPLSIDPAVNRRKWGSARSRLFLKYVSLFFAVVAVALLTNGAFEIWFSYEEHKLSLVRIQRMQAEAAAERIAQFIKEIENEVGWLTQLPWSATTLDQRRFDALRLLRQVPAITELVQMDASGHEQLRVSRLALDRIGSQIDLSAKPMFSEAAAHKVYYGPVYLRGESEPYMTLSLAGSLRDAGVTAVEVNLKLIWDVILQIEVGQHGKAYLVDATGRLIADPDISLVLRDTNLSALAQVQAARATGADVGRDSVAEATDLSGGRVLTAHAQVVPPGWTAFVELPLDEAYAPLYASITRLSILLAAGLLLAAIVGLLLARRMVVPIQTLQAGAARLGAGDLAQRISIKTGDELQVLGEQFNSMAAQLQESYGTLENKVRERTHQLELANTAKSRFLAVATHDLRQPLHALGLFLARLRAATSREEQERLFGQIDAAVTAMNELFNALLDISKLDAGVLAVSKTDFPLSRLFSRLETTFAAIVREKGLQLRIVASSRWVHTDFILLERILLNLVSNAARYTKTGGIVVGCRPRGACLRIDVCDTGIGIPEDQRRNIFSEFYQLFGPERADHGGGLGLGLAIVERLGQLLDHPIEVVSRVGRGSRFSVLVPAAQPVLVAAPSDVRLSFDPIHGRSVLVIDDDELIRDSMRSLLGGWGCRVLTAGSTSEALTALEAYAECPDLIVCDYRLAGGSTGTQAIEQVRHAVGVAVPALLVTGDTAPERLRDASASGYHLLHKPVPPMSLRALMSQMLKRRPGDPSPTQRAQSS